jgi:S-disulfanyl-L-cysteine oxidoreductase SoxD
MEVEHDAAAEVCRRADASSSEWAGSCPSRSGTGVGSPQFRNDSRFHQHWARTTACPLAAVFLGLLSLTIGISSPTSAQPVGSFYTDAQADAGQTVFASQCAICHGDRLEGKVGPALAGEQFLSVSQYQELTAGFLYKLMSRQMPKNAPGSLSKTEYLDVLAYILKMNGYPAGPRQLTDDDHELKRIKIEPTGKPQESSQTEDRQ